MGVDSEPWIVVVLVCTGFMLLLISFAIIVVQAIQAAFIRLQTCASKRTAHPECGSTRQHHVSLDSSKDLRSADSAPTADEANPLPPAAAGIASTPADAPPAAPIPALRIARQSSSSPARARVMEPTT